MRRRIRNYSGDDSSQENINYNDKYVTTGESEFSRDLAVPFDENDVLSERHFVLGDDAFEWERQLRREQERREEEDHYGKGPKGFHRSDPNIYEDVCEALWLSPKVDASEIEVSVDHGIVTLKGVVHKRDFKRAAESVIERVPGVMDVMNQIKVEPEKGGLIQENIGWI